MLRDESNSSRRKQCLEESNFSRRKRCLEMRAILRDESELVDKKFFEKRAMLRDESDPSRLELSLETRSILVDNSNFSRRESDSSRQDHFFEM